MERSASTLATLGVAAVVLGGCGAARKHTVVVQTVTVPATSSKPTPTMTQFIAQADEICKTLKSEQAQVKQRFSESSKGVTAAVQLGRQGITFSRAANAKLQALPKPASEAATIEKLLTGYGEEATDGTNALDALAHKEISAEEAAQAALTKVEAFDDGVAQTLGLKVCGKSE